MRYVYLMASYGINRKKSVYFQQQSKVRGSFSVWVDLGASLILDPWDLNYLRNPGYVYNVYKGVINSS